MRLRAIIACVLWGSAFAGAKIGLQYAEPILLSGMRFILAGLLLIPVMLGKRIDFRNELKHWRFMLTFAFLQTFLQYGLFFIGIDKVPAATSAIIVGSGPLFVALMAHFTLETDKMSFRKVIAITLGLTGIVFISLAKGNISSDNPAFFKGIGFLLLSNIVGGYTNIMVSKRKGLNLSPIFLTSFAHLVGGTLLLIVSLIFEHPQHQTFPIEFFGALTWLAIISSAGFSIWYGLLNRPNVKVSELNLWKFIIPVTGTLLSWIFVKGENPDMPTIVGILVISFALLLMQLPERFFHRFARRTANK